MLYSSNSICATPSKSQHFDSSKRSGNTAQKEVYSKLKGSVKGQRGLCEPHITAISSSSSNGIVTIFEAILPFEAASDINLKANLMTLNIYPKFNAIMSLLTQVISSTSATRDVYETLINAIGLKFKSW